MNSTLPYAPLKPPGTVRFTLIRCRWCNKPQFEAAGTATVRFKCSDRGCRMHNEVRVG